MTANIPYKMVGGVNFYARKEIKDLLCYLKTIDNARDDLAVQRIINVPKRGIGATTLGRVQDYADNMGISLYEALRSGRGGSFHWKKPIQDRRFCYVYPEPEEQGGCAFCGRTAAGGD